MRQSALPEHQEPTIIQWLTPSPKKNRNHEIFRDVTSGIIGGSAGIAVGHPLDTIRVRQQMQDRSSGSVSTYSYLRTFVRKEGVLSLFKGFWPPVLGNTPLCAVSFGAVGWANRLQDSWLVKHPSTTHPLQVTYAGDLQPPQLSRQVNSGIFSGAMTAVVATPIELVKCKMQVQKTTFKDGAAFLPEGSYKNSWDCARRVVAVQGVRGLFNGLTVTVVRDIPSWGGYFLAYEYCKWWLRTETPAKPTRAFSAGRNGQSEHSDVRVAHVSVLSTMLAGSAAGVFSWGCIYPVDVIKTIIQTKPETATARERTVWTVSKQLYAEGGVHAFFRGLTPTLLRAIPTNAVTFLVYETCMKGGNHVLGLGSVP